MTAGKYNFTIEQGATFVKTISVSADGNPLNLSGYSARLMARPGMNDEPVISLSTQTGGITIDGPNGKLTLEMSATQTAALNFDHIVR